MTFVDRENELAFLEERGSSRRAELLVVYGKRRVGKTELLKQFIRGKQAVYLLADRRPARDQLRELSRRFADLFGDDIALRKGLSDWLEVAEFLAAKVRERLVLVLDELPYLIENDPALPSLLQKAWDQTLRRLPIVLVLCGSSVAMMERETLAHHSPLYGRRTGDLRVEPLDLPAARALTRAKSFDQALELLTIAGGMPAYLLELDARCSLEDNVRTRVLKRGSLLYREVEFLVREELREPRNYLAILKAIASGRHKFGEVSSDTGLEKNVLHKYLQVLESLQLLRRDVPITEEKPHLSKRGHYEIAEPFVTFWFEYVYPYVSDLELGDSRPSMRQLANTFPALVARSYEAVARTLLRHDGTPDFAVDRVGRYWDREREIDVVGLSLSTPSIVLGEVKWSRRPVGIDVLAALREKARYVPWEQDRRQEVFALFSRSGFTPEILRLARTESLVLYHGDRRVWPPPSCANRTPA